MKRIHSVSLLAGIILSLFLAGSAFGAGEGHYYGVVESFGSGQLVVRTTQHSTGNWKVGPTTKVEGSIARYDWVFVELGRGGHVALLRLEERPTGRAGVVKEVHNRVLGVHSGNSLEHWNVTDATLGETAVDVGDEVSVKVYGNHNLAEIAVLKHGRR